jgi:hypothetical protein
MFMRHIVLILIAVAAAVPAIAQDRFTLDLEELPIADKSTASASLPPVEEGLSLGLSDSAGMGPGDDMVYIAALKPRTELEFRAALWASPMGRLHYHRASKEAMLGREGLVNGGRMQGLGMATSAIGDGDPGGLQLLMKQKSWKGLTLGDKVKAGVEASFLAAILYYMAENYD